RYVGLVAASGRTLFDRDMPPGAEPEEMMALKVPALIVPGDDPAHAASGAYYLRRGRSSGRSCLPTRRPTACATASWNSAGPTSDALPARQVAPDQEEAEDEGRRERGQVQ
ncbi:MAG TPA: alpha/beta hydrolase, partial [Methylomirabilota bacterium]|nr:alpha/beta hydrolase [Methylomirabilota bacterium]